MSDDTFTETTTESWLGRLGKAFMGVLLGLALIAASAVLLFWNEGRAVTRAKSLKEGLGIVRSVQADTIVPGNAGKLVHLSGMAQPKGDLKDTQFGIRVAAIALRRTVEMYQWEEQRQSETRKKLGGGSETVTTYTYRKTWSGVLQDSGRFKNPQGHENPPSMPYPSQTQTAAHVSVGAFALSPALIREMDAYEPLPLQSLPAPLEPVALLDNGEVYLKAEANSSPQSPRIGDARIRFSMVPAQAISVVAQQTGKLLAPYRTSVGDEIALLQTGTLTAAQLFAKAQSDNTMLTWILRGAGLLVMFIGFVFVLKPLSVALDVLPLLGNVAEMGIFLVAGLVALILGCVVIAAAWLWYRPLLGAALLAAAVAGVLLLRRMRKKSSEVLVPPGPSASPPPPAV